MVEEELAEDKSVTHRYEPITWERYGHQTWEPAKSYAFASGHSFAHLVGSELSRAAMSLPIGFTRHTQCWMPTAILNLMPGSNLFVKADGSWTQAYVPAVFRAYPFKVSFLASGEQVLCFDEGSGLLGTGEEQFFDGPGVLSAPLKNMLEMQEKLEASRVQTVKACEVLAKYDLIEPWLIDVVTASGEQRVSDFSRINEQGLLTLSPQALHEVASAGGLAVAYCQLLSMQHLPQLGALAQEKDRQQPVVKTAHAIAEDFLSQNSIMTFGR